MNNDVNFDLDNLPDNYLNNISGDNKELQF